MNSVLVNIILSLVLSSFFTGCSWKYSSSVKPNVIIVLTDDQGWGDVGYNGNQIIETPALDSLAKEAVVFNRFYVSPVCAPTRASILTGKYHLATGTSWLTHRKEVMRERETTLAEVLSENGYVTAYFGKWHNGQQYPHDPLGQGFETFFGFCAGHWNNYFDAKLESNGIKVATKGYITDVITDSVVQYIHNSPQPFMAIVAYNTPHTPYQVPDKYFNKYIKKGLDDKTAAIYGMCENIDDNVLRIQNALKAEQKHDNTIFIYLSDNGPNYVRYNGGYKGRKAQVDEGGVRVPFIINYPGGNIKSREVNDDFAAHIDLFPTILDLCKISSDTLTFNGKSFAGILMDSTKHLVDRKFYSHQIFDENSFAGSVRTNDYLLTLYPHDTALFNIKTDPFQMMNILKSENALADSLINDFNKWLPQVKSKGLIPEPIQIGHRIAPMTELPAHESALGNHVEFAGGMGWANDWVLNWTDTSDYMQWPINVVNTGRYNVKLHYVGSKKTVGDNFSLSCQNHQLNFKIENAISKSIVKNQDRVTRDEVDEVSWGSQTIGELSLQEGACLMNLVYQDNEASDIEIKGIEIYRSN
ncbi:MAG: arylsulfatase [Salinivirgaceae bacterium]|jgi:arylsulfatase A-like enzyme|nr:arylsulfatase [Salinivirgaceae bacterium]